MNARAEPLEQSRAGLADAAEAEDPDQRAADRAGRRLLVEYPSGQRGVFLRQPLGQRQREREDVLGHWLGVGAGVGGHRDAIRDLFERNAVDAGRHQLNQAA